MKLQSRQNSAEETWKHYNEKLTNHIVIVLLFCVEILFCDRNMGQLEQSFQNEANPSEWSTDQGNSSQSVVGGSLEVLPTLVFVTMRPLFGNIGSDSSSSKNLVEFKAGKMQLKNTTVTADKRKGLLYLHQSDDALMHFCWKDRNTGIVEDVRYG